MAQPDLNLGAAAAASSHERYSEGPSRFDRDPEVHAAGWRTFAATMILIAGAGNALWSIAALAGDRHFKVHELLVGNLTGWGVVLLVFAALQLVTGVLILRRNQAGVALGTAMAAASMLTQLFVIGAYPVWSVFVIAVDALVIYGLTVYIGDN